MHTDVTFTESERKPRAALHNALGTRLHSGLKSSKDKANEADKVLIAFPNDRAQSIRPGDRTLRYQ